MNWEIFKDPLLWANYASAAIGWYILYRYGRRLSSDIDSSSIWVWLIKFFCVFGGACFFAYLSWKFGDIQIEKMGLLK